MAIKIAFDTYLRNNQTPTYVSHLYSIETAPCKTQGQGLVGQTRGEIEYSVNNIGGETNRVK